MLKQNMSDNASGHKHNESKRTKPIAHVRLARKLRN